MSKDRLSFTRIANAAGPARRGPWTTVICASAALLAAGAIAAAQGSAEAAPPATAASPELPTHQIPNLGSGAEFYFSPDGTHLIGDAKREGDTSFHVYTLRIDGTDIRRINDKGDDACSYFFPDGKHIIWTSTKDHPELAASNYSDPTDYPRGAELYTSDLDGKHVKRLTNNSVYDAEVSVASNGKWILFGSQRSGKMELWKARPDGRDPVRTVTGWCSHQRAALSQARMSPTSSCRTSRVCISGRLEVIRAPRVS